MTGKSKKSTFTTGWTRLIRGAKSPSVVARKAIEFNIKELSRPKIEDRQGAAGFFFSQDYIAFCQLVGIDHCELMKSVSILLGESGARRKKIAQNIIKWVRECSREERTL